MEKLIEAGLAKVEKTKYSEKGREVKLYAPAKRFIVLVPEKTTGQAVIDALKKYLVLLPIALVTSVAVEYLSSINHLINKNMDTSSVRSPGTTGGSYLAAMNQSTAEATGQVAGHVTANGYGIVYMASNATTDTSLAINAMPSPVPKGIVPPALDHLQQTFQLADPLQHAGVWFFLGCVLVLALIALVEYARIKKFKLPWAKK